MKKVVLILVVLLLAIAGCVNNIGLSGSYINTQTNQTCIELVPDGTYLIRSIGSSLSVKANYEIKNNKLLLTIPTNPIFGDTILNNIVLTCDVNGDIINCGKEGGVYQKVDSCSYLDAKRITPTPIKSTYQCLANTSLTSSEPDKNHVTLILKYQDTCGLTTDVTFFVKEGQSRNIIYSKNLGNPGTSLVTASYTVPNVLGHEYIWNYNATRNNS